MSARRGGHGYLGNLGSDRMGVVRWPHGCLRRNLCDASGVLTRAGFPSGGRINYCRDRKRARSEAMLFIPAFLSVTA
jgi:hypothetical protein